MNEGGIRFKAVFAKRSALREIKEAESEVGVVSDADDYLIKLDRGEALREESTEMAPPGFGAEVGEDRDSGGDFGVGWWAVVRRRRSREQKADAFRPARWNASHREDAS